MGCLRKWGVCNIDAIARSVGKHAICLRPPLAGVVTWRRHPRVGVVHPRPTDALLRRPHLPRPSWLQPPPALDPGGRRPRCDPDTHCLARRQRPSGSKPGEMNREGVLTLFLTRRLFVAEPSNGCGNDNRYEKPRDNDTGDGNRSNCSDAAANKEPDSALSG